MLICSASSDREARLLESAHSGYLSVLNGKCRETMSFKHFSCPDRFEMWLIGRNAAISGKKIEDIKIPIWRIERRG